MFNQRKPTHVDIEFKITGAGGQINGSLQLDGGEYALFPIAISSDAMLPGRRASMRSPGG